MTVADYLAKISQIQKELIEFIDDEENPESKYSTLTTTFNDHKINDDKNELQLLLSLLVKIANNHHREPDFMAKIEKIMQLFKFHEIQR